MDPNAETQIIDMQEVIRALREEELKELIDSLPEEPKRPHFLSGCLQSAKLLVALLPLLFASCSTLDFGGSDSSWEWKWGWDKGVEVGEEDPENPGFDRDGNKIPSPEVLATYTFPDIHTGIAWIGSDDARITPTLNLELAEFKVPYLRWFSVQVGAGANETHVYLGKRMTSIFEVSVGPMLIRDFETNEWVGGIQGTLIKF